MSERIWQWWAGWRLGWVGKFVLANGMCWWEVFLFHPEKSLASELRVSWSRHHSGRLWSERLNHKQTKSCLAAGVNSEDTSGTRDQAGAPIGVMVTAQEGSGAQLAASRLYNHRAAWSVERERGPASAGELPQLQAAGQKRSLCSAGLAGSKVR